MTKEGIKEVKEITISKEIKGVTEIEMIIGKEIKGVTEVVIGKEIKGVIEMMMFKLREEMIIIIKITGQLLATKKLITANLLIPFNRIEENQSRMEAETTRDQKETTKIEEKKNSLQKIKD